MRRLLATQLATTILSHPQAPELVARAAREAVAAVAEQLGHRARRAVVRATIERDESECARHGCTDACEALGH